MHENNNNNTIQLKSLIINKIRNGDFLFFVIAVYIFLIPFSFFHFKDIFTVIPKGLYHAKDGFFTALMFILWLSSYDIKEKLSSLSKNIPFLILMFFLLFLYLSLLWSDNTKRGLEWLNFYKYYFLIIPVVITSIKVNQQKTLLFFFSTGIFIYSIFSLLNYYHLLPIFSLKQGHFPSPFLDYIIFSSLLSFGALFMFNSFFNEKNKKIKLLFLLLGIFFTFVLFINQSRNAQLVFSLTLILLFILHYKLSIKFIIITIFTFLIITMTITTINKSFKDRATKGIIEAYKAYDNNIYEGSIGMRIAGWLVSFDVLKENYLFGHGMGEHSDKLKVATQNDERYINIRHFGWYHNQYSEYFTAVGLLGLSIFLLFFYKLWNYQTKDELLKNLPKIFILFNLLIFIGEPILYLREYTIFFALMVGVFLV